MKVKFPKTKNILVGGFIVFLSLAIGYTIGINGFQANLSKFPKVHITRETPVKDLDFSLFWKVWDTVSSSYFDKSKYEGLTATVLQVFSAKKTMSA